MISSFFVFGAVLIVTIVLLLIAWQKSLTQTDRLAQQLCSALRRCDQLQQTLDDVTMRHLPQYTNWRWLVAQYLGVEAISLVPDQLLLVLWRQDLNPETASIRIRKCYLDPVSAGHATSSSAISSAPAP